LRWYPPGTILMQNPSIRSRVCRFPSRCIPETALASGIRPLPASRFPLGLLTREVPRPDIRFKYQDVEPTGSVSPASPSILNTRFEVKDERTFSCPASPFVINTALRLMARGFPVAVVQGSRTFSCPASSVALKTRFEFKGERTFSCSCSRIYDPEII